MNMKHKYYLLITLFSVCFAQIPSTKLQTGIITGLNFASADVEIMEEGADITSNTLLGIGFILDYGLNDMFSLRLEPMYLEKGIGKSELDIQPGVEWELKSSYLELPIFIKAEFGSDIRPYIMAGPSFGLLLSSELQAEVSGIIFEGDPKDATENMDVSAVFGCGLDYQMDKFSIFLEGRYSYGFTNTIKGGIVEISSGHINEEIEWDKETDMVKNRGFQIMAGVTFPLGEKYK
jgi:hypothetical protein